MKKLNKATVIIIASMLVLALTLVATFSWFPRAASYDDNTTYGVLNLNKSAMIKYTGLTVQTFPSSMVDGKLTQTEAEIIIGSENASYTIPAKGAAYFRTSITGAKPGTTNVSLTGLTLSGEDNVTHNISVCMLSPMKTTKAYTDGMVMAEHIEVPQSGCTVEWYLYNVGDTEAQVTITQLPKISYYE